MRGVRASRAGSEAAHAARRPTERVLVSVDARVLPGRQERVTWIRVWGSHWPPRPHPRHATAGRAGESLLPVTLTLTDHRLVMSSGTPPVELMSYDRADVRWVARMGRADDVTGVKVRCSFADETFVDVGVDESQAAALLAATAELGR